MRVLPGRLPPSQWRELASVILAATMAGMTIALTFPLLTLKLEAIGADPLTIGVSSAVGGLGIFIIGPFLDGLVRRLGAVACFRLAFLVAALCLLLFSIRTDPWLWLPIRLLYGCASATAFVLNEAAINGLVADARRGRVLGIYATLFCLGYAGGPLLLSVTGSEGRLPFHLAAGLFLLALLPTAGLRTVEARLRPPERTARARLPSFWRTAPLLFLAVLAYAFVEGAYFALMPVWVIGLGLPAASAAGLLGVWLSGNVLVQIPIGWLADRFPRQAVLAALAALGGLGTLALPQAAAAGPPALWPLLVALGGLTGGLYTLSLAMLGDRFQGSELTAANTAFVMTFQIGVTLGPLLAGAVMRACGPSSFPYLCAPPLLALVAFSWRQLRGLPGRAQS